MRTTQSNEENLRTQIETASKRLFSTEEIELRIAASLVEHGEFHENITAAELEVILRNVVYVMFSHQKVAGFDVDILHNVPIMHVKIKKHHAFVEFIVHIHKPVVVFLEFKYMLINDSANPHSRICLKDDSLKVEEKTRRFDIKAKAALAAMNVERIARSEMSDLAEVIRKTLPMQLLKFGANGELNDIQLWLNEKSLRVSLQGEFNHLSDYPEDSDP